MEEVKNVQPAASDVERLYAFLCYLLFFNILIYRTKKDSEFVLLHARQGIILFGLSLLNFVLMAIPFLGWILVPFLNLAIFILFIIGANNALSGSSEKTASDRAIF